MYLSCGMAGTHDDAWPASDTFRAAEGLQWSQDCLDEWDDAEKAKFERARALAAKGNNENDDSALFTAAAPADTDPPPGDGQDIHLACVKEAEASPVGQGAGGGGGDKGGGAAGLLISSEKEFQNVLVRVNRDWSFKVCCCLPPPPLCLP